MGDTFLELTTISSDPNLTRLGGFSDIEDSPGDDKARCWLSAEADGADLNDIARCWAFSLTVGSDDEAEVTDGLVRRPREPSAAISPVERVDVLADEECRRSPVPPDLGDSARVST